MLQSCSFVASPIVLSRRSNRRHPQVVAAQPCRASAAGPKEETTNSRRELVLNSSALFLVASVFQFGGERPRSLGVRSLGGTNKTLGLCPSTPNCISTAEELNDPAHFVPPWTYNPEDSKRGKNPVSQEQAMKELVSAVVSSKPDNFAATITQQTADYLCIEYESPFFGFKDDVEFFFPEGPGYRVEYRSASRPGQLVLPGGGDANRKRIKALREALQKKGWRSVGF